MHSTYLRLVSILALVVFVVFSIETSSSWAAATSTPVPSRTPRPSATPKGGATAGPSPAPLTLTALTPIEFEDSIYPSSTDISPDQKYVVAVLHPSVNEAVVKLWDATTGKVIRTFEGGKEVDTVHFSPNGKYLLGHDATHRGGDPTGLYVWEVETAKLLYTVQDGGRAKPVFSPDSKWLVSIGPLANGLPKLQVWDAVSGATKAALPIDYAFAHGPLVFSPDGKSILVVNAHSASILDATNGKVKANIPPKLEGGVQIGESGGQAAAWLPDGTSVLFVIDHGSLPILYDAKTLKETRRFDNSQANDDQHNAISSINFSSDSKYALTFSLNEAAARLWDVQTGKLIKVFNDDKYSSAVLSPDGKFILVGPLTNKPLKLVEADIAGNAQSSATTIATPGAAATASAGVQANLTQTYVASDKSFSFHYSNDWGTPSIQSSEVIPGVSATLVGFQIAAGKISVVFVPAKAVSAVVPSFLSSLNLSKQTKVNVAGTDATRVEGPAGIGYVVTFASGDAALVVGSHSPLDASKLDPILQAIVASIKAPAGSGEEATTQAATTAVATSMTASAADAGTISGVFYAGGSEQCSGKSCDYSLLRFYSDGAVISTSTELTQGTNLKGAWTNINKWFNRDSPRAGHDIGSGTYHLDGTSLTFSQIGDGFKVDYTGTYSPNKLVLSWQAANGNSGHAEYVRLEGVE